MRRTAHPRLTPRLLAQRVERAAQGLLIALLVFMPLALGVVRAWSEAVVLVGTAVLVAMVLLRTVLDRSRPLVGTWLYVPIVLFLAMGVLQLVPLPPGVAGVISPETVAMKQRLLADVPGGATSLERITFSFYPLATRHDLRLLMVTSAFFACTLSLFRDAYSIRRLLIAIAGIGGTVSLLAIAQNALGLDAIYGLIPTPRGRADGGTFVNRSHFAQFANMSMGAAMAVLLTGFRRRGSVQSIGGARGDVPRSGVPRRPSPRVLWAAGVLVGVGAIAVAMSLSRGGIASMLLAGGLTAAMIGLRGRLRGAGTVLAVIALGAFAVITYVAFNSVYDRAALLFNVKDDNGGRLQMARDIARMWPRFPVTGTGLGTHAVVYPAFETSLLPTRATHAENEYMQLLEEGGAIGVLLLICFATGVWVCYARCLKRSASPLQPEAAAVAIGLGYGLTAVMVHSLSDFGQHLPANACLTAVCCAMLVTLSRLARGGAAVPESSEAAPHASRVRIGTGGAIALAALSWAIFGGWRAWQGESHWSRVQAIGSELREADWIGPNEQYAKLINHGTAALAAQSDNAHYRHWLNVYRWYAITRVRDPETGERVMTPATTGFARRIVDELWLACIASPTRGDTFCFAGQIAGNVLKDPAAPRWIRRGFELAPANPTACVTAALLDADAGDLPAAMNKYHRALAVDVTLFPEIALVLSDRCKRPDLAVELAWNDRGRLTTLLERLKAEKCDVKLIANAEARSEDLLLARCNDADAPAGVLGEAAAVFLKKNDAVRAAEYYRRALEMDFGNVEWHLSLARALQASGDREGAVREATVCLRLRPGMAAAKELVEKLEARARLPVTP